MAFFLLCLGINLQTNEILPPFRFTSFLTFRISQSNPYSVLSYHEKGNKAPNTHYIGEAWLKGVMQADELFNYNITKTTFKANSTLDWHKHSGPQILIIVEGEGYYQEKGKQPIRIKEGDILKCTPGIEHWHASSKEKDVTYLAIYNGGY